MRRALIVLTFAAFTVTGATRQPPIAFAQPTLSVQQQSPVSVDWLSPSTIRFLEWAVTQGGLTIVLLFVLAAYRRDFFRKVERFREDLEAKERDRQDMKQLLRENAAANQAHALAVLQNTNATEKLAASVDRFAERRQPPKP